MSINSFLATPAQSPQGQSLASMSGMRGTASLGRTFFDMLLTLAPGASVTGGQSLALHQPVSGVVESQPGAQEKLFETFTLNKKAFETILNPAEDNGVNSFITIPAQGRVTGYEKIDGDPLLLEGAPENLFQTSQHDDIKSLTALLEDLLGKLKQLESNISPLSASSEQDPETAKLIASIKKLLQRLEEMQAAAGPLGQALPVPQKKPLDVSIKALTLDSPENPSVTQDIAELKARLTAQLNNLLAGKPAMADADLEAGLDEGDFSHMLNEKLQKPAGENNNIKPSAKAMENAVHTLPTLPAPAAGLAAFMDWGQSYGDEFAVYPGSAPVTGLAAMTSAVTHAPSAAQPHPAIQTVAVHIAKAAAMGEDKTFRVQLDPPELGRVDVRMSIAKDKSVKAVVTAEKAETFMMLQRDAHVLERALQSAGLDAHGSLSFELAQDGHEFGHNGGHDGQGQHGSRASGDDTAEILESSMTWHVDPDTGHMRYNIFA